MKRFLVTFLIGLVVGWYFLGQFNSEPLASEDDNEAYPNRISLLGGGGVTDEDIIRETPLFEEYSSVTSALTKIDAASPAESKRWLLALAQSPRSSPDLMNTIVGRLAASDPKGTYSFLIKNGMNRSYQLTALTAWAEVDLDAVIEVALGKDPDGSFYLEDMIPELSAEVQERLYKNMLERGFDKTNPSIITSLLVSLNGSDYEKSAQSIAEFNLQSNAQDWLTMTEALLQWHEVDPEAAFRWAYGNADPEVQKQAMRAFSGERSRHDARFLGFAWNEMDENDRDRFASQINLSDDTDNLLKWIDKNVESPVLHARMLINVLGGFWQSNHPEKLADIVAQFGPDTADSNLLDAVQRVSSNWNEADPEGFNAWIDTLENPHIQAAAHRGLQSHWAQTDPSKLLDYWETQEISLTNENREFYQHRIRDLLRNISEFSDDNDPQALIARLPEAMRDYAIEEASYLLSQRNTPEEVIEFLNRQPPGESRNNVIQASVADWAMENPSQAAEWVTTLPEGRQRDSAAQNLANAWARFDLDSAQAWLIDQPPSSSRDKAAEQMIQFAAHDDLEVALSLVRAIGDEEKQQRLLQQAVSAGARRDPNRITEQVRAVGFSADLVRQANQVIEQERALRAVFAE